MMNTKKYFLLIGLIFISTASNAANIWCSGTISNAYVDSGNNLMIKGSWRNDYTRICKTDGSGEINTITCSLWFSIATSSMTNDKGVTLMYSDQGGTIDCTNIPSYSAAPIPKYLMLVR